LNEAKSGRSTLRDRPIMVLKAKLTPDYASLHPGYPLGLVSASGRVEHNIF